MLLWNCGSIKRSFDSGGKVQDLMGFSFLHLIINLFPIFKLQ